MIPDILKEAIKEVTENTELNININDEDQERSRLEDTMDGDYENKRDERL